MQAPSLHTRCLWLSCSNTTVSPFPATCPSVTTSNMKTVYNFIQITYKTRLYRLPLVKAADWCHFWFWYLNWQFWEESNTFCLYQLPTRPSPTPDLFSTPVNAIFLTYQVLSYQSKGSHYGSMPTDQCWLLHLSSNMTQDLETSKYSERSLSVLGPSYLSGLIL